MTSVKQEFNIVNNSPSAVSVVAAGGLATLRSNWTILIIATGRTPEAVAVVDVYGRRPRGSARPFSILRLPFGITGRVVAAVNILFTSAMAAGFVAVPPPHKLFPSVVYKDYIALTFLGTNYACVSKRMVRP